MPHLQIDLSSQEDIRSGIRTLRQLLRAQDEPKQARAQGDQPCGGRARKNRWRKRQEMMMDPLLFPLMEMRRKRIWKFLLRVAKLKETEYSLPELARLLDLSTPKVVSLKAIIAKPENRLGIKFFEATEGSQDDKGNPRYRLNQEIRDAILATDMSEVATQE